jgi:hypothetical protein
MKNEALVMMHLVVPINVDTPKEREEKWTIWQVETLNIAKWTIERLVKIIVQVNVQKAWSIAIVKKVGHLNF